MRPVHSLASLLSAALLLASCANIIDVEERKVSDGGAGDCAEYCQQARSLCTMENGAEVFYTDQGCLGSCAAYQPGDTENPTGNTLACRMNQLAKVRDIGEPPSYCPGAGPGGGSANVADTAAACGSNCEGYCSLYAYVCGEIPDCVRKCGALRDDMKFNATADFSSGEDSLQCRLAHLTAAAAAKSTANESDRVAHCSHSGIKSSSQCDVADKLQISCVDFCKIADAGCTGANKVYENQGQCQKVCAQLTSGSMAELLGNNVRCRRENAYSALTGTALNTALACSNAGPAPVACGSTGKCESYCKLAQAGCAAGFKAKYNDDVAACAADCGNLADVGQNFLYSTEAAVGARGTLHCRVLRVARALGGDTQPGTCEAAFGGGDCQ